MLGTSEQSASVSAIECIKLHTQTQLITITNRLQYLPFFLKRNKTVDIACYFVKLSVSCWFQIIILIG